MSIERERESAKKSASEMKAVSEKLSLLSLFCGALKSTSESQALILVTRNFCHFGFVTFILGPLKRARKVTKVTGFREQKLRDEQGPR